MIKKSGPLLTLVAVVLAGVGACQSSGDDSGRGEAAAGSDDAGASGVGGRDGNSTGTAGIGGANDGGDTAGTGGPSAGGADELPSAGAAGYAGTSTGAGGTKSTPSTDEAGADDGVGEAGSPALARPEYGYLTTFLGGIVAFSIDPVSGKPNLLPGSPVDASAQIYAVSADQTQRHLYVLDLLHKLDVFSINADGSLPSTPAFSTPIEGSPVTLALDPKGHFVYVGTRTDEPKTFIEPFRINAVTGALAAAGDSLELGGAPSYVAVDPTGHFAYVTESTGVGIWGYTIDQTTGLLTQIGTLPFGGNAVFGGAIAFRPDGKFLYTAGNGLNGFAIDSASGELQPISPTPFNTDVSSDPTATSIAMDPRGKFLYATAFGTSLVFGFSIDDTSGMLTAVPGQPTAVSMPYSVGVEPSGRFMYAGSDDGKLSAFTLRRADGTLSEVDGSPIDQGGLQPELAFAVPISH